MLMLATLVPYIAFAGAAFLLGWVGYDLVKARLRRPLKPQLQPEDSGRGLVSKPVPYSARIVARPVSLDSGDSRPNVRLSDRIEAQPDMPVSQAWDMADEEPAAESWTEDAEDRAVVESSVADQPEAQPEEFEPQSTESEPDAAPEPATVYNDGVVRKDASVRVYDTSVASSGRQAV